MSNKVSFADSRRLGLANPYPSDLVESEGNDPDPEVLSVKEQLLALRPKGTPAWVTSLRPLNPVVTGKDGWRLLVGSWPGNETDEEIDCLLKQIDDEDSGRA